MRPISAVALICCFCTFSGLFAGDAVARSQHEAEEAPNGSSCVVALQRGDASACARLDHLSLERFRKVETSSPDEAIIRVHDGAGRYELRKIRFGALPRDVVLAIERREELRRVLAATDWRHDHPPKDVTTTGPFDPLIYVPVAALPYVQIRNRCD